jgi:hypothetical protein
MKRKLEELAFRARRWGKLPQAVIARELVQSKMCFALFAPPVAMPHVAIMAAIS